MNDQSPTNNSTNTEQALRKTLNIICGKWRLYIIYQLSSGPYRYGELRRLVPDVSEKILVQELKALISLGVIEKKSPGELPPRVDYSLTDKARQIMPMLLELTAIGEVFLEP